MPLVHNFIGTFGQKHKHQLLKSGLQAEHTDAVRDMLSAHRIKGLLQVESDHQASFKVFRPRLTASALTVLLDRASHFPNMLKDREKTV